MFAKKTNGIMMVTTKFYLDTRSGAAPYPLKLRLTMDRKSVYVDMNIRLLPEQWNGLQVVKHPRAAMLNNQLLARKAEIDCRIYELMREKKRGLATLKSILGGAKEETTDFFSYYERAMNRRSKNTQKVYKEALKKIQEFDAEASFENIDRDWLYRFDAWMGETRPSANARSIIMRCIRAVFNDAIDDELTTNYPFRKFKIKQEPTKKRALTLVELRELITYPVEEYQERYRDLFVLMILMRGINIGDLCLLRDADVVNGRIEYVRQKTHKPYSIKIEPEMMEIINRYKGEDYLINVCDTYKDYRSFYSRMNKELKKIGQTSYGKQGKKSIVPLHPKLSTYWTRHTFATIAHVECGVSIDVIAEMLGHTSGPEVTNIYIRKNERVADEAARKIIDKVLYGK